MIGDFKVGNHGLAEALHLDVGAVVRADGNGGVDDVGDVQHEVVDLLGVLALQALQLLQALVIGLHGGHVGVDLGLDGGLFLLRGLLQLAEQGAVCLGELIFLGAQVAGLGDGGTVETVKLDHLIHHGQLLVLELLLDVLLDELRVLS